MHNEDNSAPSSSARRHARRAANRRARHAAAREASTWRFVEPSLLCGIEFAPHELPYAQLMDRLLAARRRLIANAPDKASTINAEFDKLEDALAQLPTELNGAKDDSGVAAD